MSLPGGAIEMLFDSNTVPEVDGGDRMFRHQHAIDGRVWFITDFPDLDRIVLHDLLNDGEFDGVPEIIDNDEFNNRYGLFAPDGVMTDNFVDDW